MHSLTVDLLLFTLDAGFNDKLINLYIALIYYTIIGIAMYRCIL